MDGAVHKAATAVKAAKAAKKTRVAALATLPTTAFNEIGRKVAEAKVMSLRVHIQIDAFVLPRNSAAPPPTTTRH